MVINTNDKLSWNEIILTLRKACLLFLVSAIDFSRSPSTRLLSNIKCSAGTLFVGFAIYKKIRKTSSIETLLH